MHYLNLMVDLETMSKEPNAAIVELGACFFTLDPTGKSQVFPKSFWYSPFNKCVDLKSNTKYDRDIDPDTVLWWIEQAKVVKPEWASKNRYDLFNVLQDFERWLCWVPDEIRPRPLHNQQFCIWSHGSCFDIPILQSAMEATSTFSSLQSGSNMFGKSPWHYRNVRDTRTLFALADFDYEAFVRKNNKEGEGAHTALADAICQAEGVITAFNKLHKIGKTDANS